MELPRLVKSLIGSPERLLQLLLGVAVIALWISHLNHSLWLDELQTAWVVSGSFAEAASRAFHTQGFTPFYYFLIWLLRPLLGSSEIGLRVPSIVLTLGSTGLVFLLGRTFITSRAALVAALLFVCLDSVIDTAITARPYALALFLALLSFHSFECWHRLGLRRHKFLFVVSTLLTIYAHFLFAGILVLELLYWGLYCTQSRIKFSSLCGAFLYIAIGVIPTFAQVQTMLAKRDLMAIARMPTISDFLLNSIPWLTFLSILIAYFIAMGCLPKEKAFSPDASAQEKLDRRLIFLLTTWTLLPAGMLFAGSYMLGTSMFVPRYFEWASPGAALLGAALLSKIQSKRTQYFLPLFFLMFCMAAECTKDREPENWRGAVQKLAQQRSDSGAPLLFYSGVIESSNPEWLVDPIKQGQFLSPLLYYPLPQPIFLLPFEFGSEEAKAYWSRSVRPRMPPSGPLYVLMLDNLSWTDDVAKRVSIVEEMEKLVQQEGYVLLAKEQFKRVWILSFEKSV